MRTIETTCNGARGREAQLHCKVVWETAHQCLGAARDQDRGAKQRALVKIGIKPARSAYSHRAVVSS